MYMRLAISPSVACCKSPLISLSSCFAAKTAFSLLFNHEPKSNGNQKEDDRKEFYLHACYQIDLKEVKNKKGQLDLIRQTIEANLNTAAGPIRSHFRVPGTLPPGPTAGLSNL